MKIECSVEKFKKAIMAVSRISSRNSTLTALGSVLLIASTNQLKVRATNLSLGIEMEVPAKVIKEGIIAIKSETIVGTVTSLNGSDKALLEIINNNLNIKSGKNEIILKAINHEDFPVLPSVTGEEFFVNSEKIVNGIKSVYYSASFSEIKPEISSVYIYSEEDNLVFVSTDSFRLAEKKIKIKEAKSFKPVIIPLKNTAEILRALDELEEGELKINTNKNQISISSSSLYLTSRIVDGTFPDYRQIVEKNHTTDITCLKQDLVNALKIATVFSDRFNQVDISIKPKEKKVVLTSKNTEIGENQTILDAVISGEGLEISLNQKYLLECLQSISADSVTIYVNTPNKPILVRGVNDPSFLYLIMPLSR